MSSDGRYFRHAPLPADGATPRVFAAIATSLVDEMIVPPDAPAIDVDVHVHVGPDGAVAAAPTAMIAPPGFAAVAPAALAVAETAVPVRANRVLFEVGPMLSPLTFGIEAELTFPISDHVRLGAIGIADITFVDETIPIFGAAAELRYVGSGSRHWDIGAIAGAAEGDGDAVGFGGVRLSRAWEGAHRGTAFSITPLLVSDGAETFPGLYAALHWTLPL
ncbi:MAG TPA: hypothetical protein VFQ53_17355 [Kofleriaceae bacterium]|nr:hypothetical protein [Kofleriaceae bacterium]